MRTVEAKCVIQFLNYGDHELIFDVNGDTTNAQTSDKLPLNGMHKIETHTNSNIITVTGNFKRNTLRVSNTTDTICHIIVEKN